MALLEYPFLANVVPFVTYLSCVRQSNLVLHWPLDIDNGVGEIEDMTGKDSEDVVGRDNHGLVEDNDASELVWSFFDYQPTACSGSMRIKAATNARIGSIPESGHGLPEGTSSRTMTMWAKVPDQTPPGSLIPFGYGRRDQQGQQLGFRRVGLAGSDKIWTITGYDPTEFSTPATTEWRHFALIYTGSVYELYVDGSLVSPDTTAGTGINTQVLVDEENHSGFYVGRYVS